jgi:hypothetical protein
MPPRFYPLGIDRPWESMSELTVEIPSSRMPRSAISTARAPAAFAAVTGVKLTTAPLTPAGRTAAPSAIPPRVPAIPPRSLAHGRVLLARRTALS